MTSDEPPAPHRHVVLVGLPGSGKTRVGRAAAERLGAPFVDLDEQIEAETGRSIGALFRERGEAAFRELERRAMALVLARPPMLIAAGGGWAAQPGAIESAREPAFIIYLRVAAATAAARVAGGPERPLLRGDTGTLMAQLLAAREPRYLAADAIVDNEGDPADATERVMALACREARWPSRNAAL